MGLERQLQLREMMKTGVAGTAVEQEQRELKRIERENMSEEARENFANRLTAARKKCEEQAAKRAQEEANILRSWHMKTGDRHLQTLTSSRNRTDAAARRLP